MKFDYAELIGTIGSVVVLFSMCFDVEKPVGNFLLRFLNVVGCIIYIYYGFLISSISVVTLNIILLVINAYYVCKPLFQRLRKKKNNSNKNS